MLVILVLALLLFGPKRLPEIGRTIGKGLTEFRRATNELKRSIETEIEVEEAPRRPTPVPPSVAGARAPTAPSVPRAAAVEAPEEQPGPGAEAAPEADALPTADDSSADPRAPR